MKKPLSSVSGDGEAAAEDTTGASMARSVPVTLGEVETTLAGCASMVTSPWASVTVRGQVPEPAPSESASLDEASGEAVRDPQALSARAPATPTPPRPSSERRLT